MELGDETSLLERLQRGDDGAYELLVRTYGGRMLAVARTLLRNEEDARDAVQDAYVSAFNGLARFQGVCQLGTWLHRIVVNAALMKLRTRRRKQEESIEPLLPTFLDDGHHTQDFAEWAGQADRMLETKESCHTVRAAIAMLPEGHRTVLVLRDIEERSTEEVARELGITANAVKIRLHRARQALVTLLRSNAFRNLHAIRDIKGVDSPQTVDPGGERGAQWPTPSTPRAIRSLSISRPSPA